MARLVAILGVAIFLFIGLHGVAGHYETTVTETNDQIEVTNETFTVQHGTVHQLDESNRDVVYNGTVEVYQSGFVIGETRVSSDNGSNWRWIEGNGTLYVPNGSDMNDGDTAEITYRYTEPTSEQKVAKDVAMVPFILGDGLLIVLGAVLLLTAVALLGRQR